MIESLDRKAIDKYLQDWNERRLLEGEKLENLHFCSEDEEEDNDTDEEFEGEKQREMDNCKRNE